MATLLTQQELARARQKFIQAGGRPESFDAMWNQRVQAGTHGLETESPISDVISQKGLPGQIIGGVTRMAERPARFLLGARAGLGMAGQALLGNEAAKQRVLQGDIPFLSQRQERMARGQQEGIGLEGAKMGAQIGSFLIPSSTALKASPLLVGAGRGALSGFGQGEVTGDLGQDVSSTALGTAVGAGTGAVTESILSKIFNRKKTFLGEAGREIKRTVREPMVGSRADFVQEENAIMQTMDDYGMKGSARAQAEKLPKVLKVLSKDINKKLVGKNVNVQNIIDDIDDSFNQNFEIRAMLRGNDKEAIAARDTIVNMLKEKSKNGQVTDKTLFEFKRAFGNTLGRAFDKVHGRSQANLTKSEIVGLQVWDNLDDIITTINPEVKVLTKTQSVLLEAVRGLKKQAGARVYVPVVGGSKLVARPLQAVGDVVGRGLQGAERIQTLPSRISPQIAGGVQRLGTQQAAGAAARAAQPSFGQRMLTGQVPPQQAMLGQVQPQAQVQPQVGPEATPDIIAEAQASIRERPLTGQETLDNRINEIMVNRGMLPEARREVFPQAEEGRGLGLIPRENIVGMLQNDYINAKGSNIGIYLAQSDLTRTEQDQLLQQLLAIDQQQNAGRFSGNIMNSVLAVREAEEKKKPETSQGANALDFLKTLFTRVQQAGLTGGATPQSRLRGFKGEAAALTQSNPDAAAYNSIKAAFGTSIARAGGEKGTMTDKDRDVILKALPDFNDTEATVVNKWAGFQTLLGVMEKKYGMTPGELTNLLGQVAQGTNVGF